MAECDPTLKCPFLEMSIPWDSSVFWAIVELYIYRLIDDTPLTETNIVLEVLFIVVINSVYIVLLIGLIVSNIIIAFLEH